MINMRFTYQYTNHEISIIKDHRQRIPKNCYKMIFRKINMEENFFQLTFVTNKDYFSRKKLFTVAVYVILSSLIGANCECL